VSRGGVIHSFLVTGVQQVRKEIVLPFTQARKTRSLARRISNFPVINFFCRQSQLDSLVVKNQIDHPRGSMLLCGRRGENRRVGV
jgi:hypothetical protein